MVFDNLPDKCTIKIYTISGDLVYEYKKDDTETRYEWDTVNTASKQVTSGVYVYVVHDTDDTKNKVTGKIVIVR